VSEQDRFDHELRGWLRGAAARRAPDYLVPMAMAAVHGTRQRRAMPFSYPVSWFALAGVATVAMVIVAVAVLAPPVAPPTVGSPPPAIGSASSSSQSRPSVPAQAPTPLDLPSFTTPLMTSTDATWRSLTWSKLDPGNSLADVSKMVEWHGAYLAIGHVRTLASAGGFTPIWHSTDGTTWEPMPADTFGASSAILAIGRLPSALVALTVEATCSESAEPVFVNCRQVSGGITSWTSNDGLTWLPHTGPHLSISESLNGVGDLVSGPAGLLAVVQSDRPTLAVSSDGVSWDVITTDAMPQSFELGDVWGRADGYAAVGTLSFGSKDKPQFKGLAFWSNDGRNWSSSIAEPLTAGNDIVLAASEPGELWSLEEIVGGRDGAIAIGHAGGTPGITTWWHSDDGRSWRQLADYPPLGVWNGEGEGTGGAPDGRLASDGARTVAIRLTDDAAAWTSFDGSTWTPLTFEGAEPPDGDVTVLPGAILLFDGQSTWFGAANRD
jgi:hypothetical protein